MSRFGDAMKVAAVSLVSACVALLIATAAAAESPPRWAYPENNPNYKPPLDDGNLVRVPEARPVIPGPSFGTNSLRPSGTQLTIRRCRTS